MENIIIKILEQVKCGKLPIKLAQEQLFNLFGVNKRYKIQGTSFTTNSKKWFEFDEEGWKEFKTKRWTHYPAWSFDDDTITEFNVC